MKQEKMYFYFSILSVTLVVISNVIAGRLFDIGGYSFPSSILLFPFIFVISNILTEVYGPKKSMKVTICGFVANLILVLFCYIATVLPAPANWELTDAFNKVFLFTPRVLLASLTAFAASFAINIFLMAFIKKLTKGKYLWLRTLVATLIGFFVDTFIFLGIGFGGLIPFNTLILMILIQTLFKLLFQVVLLPLVYYIVKKVKEDKASEESANETTN